MTVVLKPSPHVTDFKRMEPQFFNTKTTKKNSVEEETTIKLNAKNLETSLGAVICDLQQKTEAKYDAEIKKNLNISKQLQEKLKNINAFIENIDGALANNPNAKTISFADKSELVEKIKEIMPDPLLEKTQWSRTEAESLSKILSRHSESIMQQAEEVSREMNWSLSDKHECLTTFREILKTFIDAMSLAVRNQKI